MLSADEVSYTKKKKKVKRVNCCCVRKFLFILKNAELQLQDYVVKVFMVCFQITINATLPLMRDYTEY